MAILRGMMLVLALVAGQAAAQTAVRMPPSFPLVMDIPEAPWTTPARALYEQLMAPNWTPVHELVDKAPHARWKRMTASGSCTPSKRAER